MSDQFAKTARMELAWILGATDARDIQVEAFARMENALRMVAEETRRQCAAVARSYFPTEPGPEGEDIAAAIEALDLGTAPTVEQSSTVHDPVAAAAPDMLEALEGVLPYMAAAEKSGLVGNEGCHWPVEAVRAAIAAAKGVRHDKAR